MSEPGFVSVVLFAAMALLLASGVWVAVSLPAMGFTGVPRAIAGHAEARNLSATGLLVVLTLLYILLGCFFDGVSMLEPTASVVLPMVEDAGINLLWFGVFTAIVVEMAQITPPCRSSARCSRASRSSPCSRRW